MSLRPGIGHGIVDRMVKAYDSVQGNAALSKQGWIAEKLRIDQKQYHYGRYLKTKILDRMEVPKDVRQLHHVEVQCNVLQREEGKSAKVLDREHKAKLAAESGKIQALRVKAKTL